MNAPVMLREKSRLDMHAAIIACRLFDIAVVAIERPAMEELFEPSALPVNVVPDRGEPTQGSGKSPAAWTRARRRVHERVFVGGLMRRDA